MVSAVMSFTALVGFGCLYSGLFVSGAPGGDRNKHIALCQELCSACNGLPRLDGYSCMCQVNNEKDLECLQIARRKALDKSMKLVPRLVEYDGQYNARYKTRRPIKGSEYEIDYPEEAPEYEGSRYPRCVGSALIGAVREKIKLRQEARLASKASAGSAGAVVGAKTPDAVSLVVGAETPEAVVAAEKTSNVGSETAEAVVGAEKPSNVGSETSGAVVGAEKPSNVGSETSEAVVGAEPLVGAEVPAAEAKEAESENVVGAAKPSALSAEKAEGVVAVDKGAVLGSQAIPAIND